MGLFVGNRPTQQIEWDPENEEAEINVLFELVRKRVDELQGLASTYQNKSIKPKEKGKIADKLEKLLELTKGNLNQIRSKLSEELLYG